MSHQVNKTEADKTETLFGGAEMTVKLLNGATKTVRVRQLPVREMRAFLQAQDDEARMIELACKLDAATVDALAPKSHEALIAAVEKVNADFFGRWLDRLKQRTEKLMPGAAAVRRESLISSPSPASKPA